MRGPALVLMLVLSGCVVQDPGPNTGEKESISSSLSGTHYPEQIVFEPAPVVLGADGCPTTSPGKPVPQGSALRGSAAQIADSAAAAFDDRLVAQKESDRFDNGTQWKTEKGDLDVGWAPNGRPLLYYSRYGSTLGNSTDDVKQALTVALARLGFPDPHLVWRVPERTDGISLFLYQGVGNTSLRDGGYYRDGVTQGQRYAQVWLTGLMSVEGVVLRPWAAARAVANQYALCKLAGNETALATLEGPKASPGLEKPPTLGFVGDVIVYAFVAPYGADCDTARAFYIQVDAQTGALISASDGGNCGRGSGVGGA